MAVLPTPGAPNTTALTVSGPALYGCPEADMLKGADVEES